MYTVFVNVGMMLLYMVIGFVLVKTKLGITSHAKSMSGLLIYILGPCMIINSFQKMEYSMELFRKTGIFFGVTLLIQALFFALLYVVFHRKFEDAKYRIMCAGGTLGNVGFLGLPIVTALFPNDPIVACYSSIYVMSMNMLVFTVGIFMITNDRKYMSIKSIFLNPTAFALYIAIPLYLLKFHFPTALADGISLLGKMTTPLCMVILGMRLAGVELKKLFSRPTAYLAVALKLIVFPLFAYLCVAFFPFFDQTFKICVLVLSAAPTGAIVLSLSELHECEQELSANVVLLTTIFSVITIPLIMLIANM